MGDINSDGNVDFQTHSCEALNLRKPVAEISTGLGFLDHMLDQFYSHAQIGVSIQVTSAGTDQSDHNRHSKSDQNLLLMIVGAEVGKSFRKLLDQKQVLDAKSKFACPLDEALTVCRLHRNIDADGELELYTLAPYGKYPSSGRSRIGHLQTGAISKFWEALAKHSGLSISLQKIRGDNAHHIVESSFKAFSRALRNMLDGIDTERMSDSRLAMYGPDSDNSNASITLSREGSVTRQTKETSIATTLKFDGGSSGIKIATGVSTLDAFFEELAKAAGVSLAMQCQGDLWIDEHHTAEDVSIAFGQVLCKALESKAGLNRMWCAVSKVEDSEVEVTMDLSNRPFFQHNLSLESDEMVGDLSAEMFEHVMDSIVINSRMTVHICQLSKSHNLQEMLIAVARAFGEALNYCTMLDSRRAGVTASSKGTLTV
jgi:imidazoleglycerol-phosphate dehydratase